MRRTRSHDPAAQKVARSIASRTARVISLVLMLSAAIGRDSATGKERVVLITGRAASTARPRKSRRSEIPDESAMTLMERRPTRDGEKRNLAGGARCSSIFGERTFAYKYA